MMADECHKRHPWCCVIRQSKYPETQRQKQSELTGCRETLNLMMLGAGLLEGWTRGVTLFTVSILLSYLNYRGLTIVGRAAIGMTLFIVLTFLVLIGLSIPRLHPSNWLVVDLGTVEWRPFINVMFW